eukprot:g15301.t1
MWRAEENLPAILWFSQTILASRQAEPDDNPDAREEEKRKMAFLWALISLASIAWATDNVIVVKPDALAKNFTDNKIPSSPALFGIPPAGRSMVGKVYSIQKSDLNGCEPFKPEEYQNVPSNCRYNNTTNNCTLFFMVDRGDCNFVEKVRHVQSIGGHAAIIVDNLDESNLPFMADDGTGGDIVIPSVLIGKNAGNEIRKYGDGNVVLKFIWSIPNPDGRVEWTMWSTPVDRAARDFKNTFGHAVDYLSDAQQFTPHFVVLDGDVYGCHGGLDDCGNQCTNNGRYCAVDPESEGKGNENVESLDTGLSGADSIKETLRSICVFNVSAEAGKPRLWWTYTKIFQEICWKSESNTTFNEQCSFNRMTDVGCSFNRMTDVGVDVNKVKKCIQDSGGTDGNAENKLLKAEIQAMKDYGVHWWPILYINTEPYYESLQCPSPMDVTTCGVLNMICGGYSADSSLPCACKSNPGCDLCEGTKDECGVCLPEDSKKRGKSCRPTLSTANMIIIVLVAFLVVGVVVVIYMRKQQSKMREDIDNLLAQYQPLGNVQSAASINAPAAKAGLLSGNEPTSDSA